MAIPEAALPPFAPPINGDYEGSRMTIQAALDELYRSCQILAATATSITGFATQDQIVVLQLQIDANTALIVALQAQVDAIDLTPSGGGTGSSLWIAYSPAEQPSLGGDNIGIPFRVRGTGLPEKGVMVVEDRDGGSYHYHTIYQAYQ